MKVIDIKKIIEVISEEFDKVIYKTLDKHNDGWGDVCMFLRTRELFNLKIRLINILNDEIEIIEDKKIELQELKTYSGENYGDDKSLIVDKINEIIDYLKNKEEEVEE